MYLNVLSFTNGKTLSIQTEVPISVDKIINQDANNPLNDWNIVTDMKNGQISSFRGSQIVTISSAPVIEKEEPKPEDHKKPGDKKRGLKVS